jgi:hypothetical protein
MERGKKCCVDGTVNGLTGYFRVLRERSKCLTLESNPDYLRAKPCGLVVHSAALA